MSGAPRYVIGLTGLPSSGKGEVVAAFMAFAHERGLRAEHLSFSDQIKDEARSRGYGDDQFERSLLSRIGTEMRETEGPGVLAARIVKKIETWTDPCPDIFVVEALRHVGEVETLRAAYGDRFTFIAVESDLPVIARRLIARRRPDESREAMQSEDNAIRLLEEELNGAESSQSPNVGQTMALADVHILNNGTLDKLRRETGRVFAKIVGA